MLIVGSGVAELLKGTVRMEGITYSYSLQEKQTTYKVRD